MTFSPDIHHRRSIRLRNHDYSSVGACFVTICTAGRECLFGDVVDGTMRLNEAGWVVDTVWRSLPQRYPGIEMDAFVVMPNHTHGIIVINDTLGTSHASPSLGQGVGAIHELPLRNRRNMTLPKIIGYLKMNSAKRINQSRDNPGAPVWQRNYYERIIRDDRELNGIRQYIVDNPAKWEEDENHPSRQSPAN